MARVEADRDDLMHDVVALVRRVELETPDGRLLVVGLRSTGRLSLYFSGDEVYQFDETGRLRRSYLDGLLYRSQGTTLARLRRERSDHETVLYRTDLTSEELECFQRQMGQRITDLRQRWETGELRVRRAVPENDPTLIPQLQAALDAIGPSAHALSPALK